MKGRERESEKGRREGRRERERREEERREHTVNKFLHTCSSSTHE